MPAGTKLVGRASELGWLSKELRHAWDGEFRCVLLTGEAGMGKTPLSAEFLARSRHRIAPGSVDRLGEHSG